MSRIFPNFLDAYLEYSNDSFVPPQFNLWSALSIIAGALERRVWLPWDDTHSFYPNIYVLLVSMPGDGKSHALNRAVSLLLDANRKTSTLNIMPNQVTEAKFIELMGYGRSFTEQKGGREITHRQNAGYYWASEASNALKNVFGDFIACLTDFYDCPNTWERATKKDLKKIQLTNVCMNLIAGSTFDYLGKLVTDENIQGGFASRLIYVVSKNKEVVEQQFGGSNTADEEMRKKYREALVNDLVEISKTVGPMYADREFGAAWEAWYPEFERSRRKLESEKLQSIVARTNTNVLKVAMLLSIAESGERKLKLNHWERALDLVTTIQGQVPAIFQQARANSSEKSNGNIADAILQSIENNPGITFERVHARLVRIGYQSAAIDQVIKALIVDRKVDRLHDNIAKIV